MADRTAAHDDATMRAIRGLEAAIGDGVGIVEVAPDLTVQAGLVVLDREQIVAAAVEDGDAGFEWQQAAQKRLERVR